MKEFLDMLADLMAVKYFERMDDRMKKIPELRRLITAKEASQFLSLSTETATDGGDKKALPGRDRVPFDLKALTTGWEAWFGRRRKKQELSWRRARVSPAKSLRESDLDLLKKKGRNKKGF
jgi:hypothetical protein